MPYNLTLTDTIPFGEHKDKLVEDTIVAYPTYFRWAIGNNVVELDDEAYKFYDDVICDWVFENEDSIEGREDCY